MSKHKKLPYVVGQKQVLREMRCNNLHKVILANDADENYKNTILSEAKIYGVEVVVDGTMQNIAEQYSIEVPTATVGFLVKFDT